MGKSRLLKTAFAGLCISILGLTGCSSSTEQTTAAQNTEAQTEAGKEESSNEQSQAQEESSSSKKYVFMSGTMSNSFFIAISDKFQSLCDDAGYSYSVYDCDWDSALQLTQMEDVVNSKPDMIFFVAADVDGAREGLQYAHNAGVPVMVIDNPVPDTDLVISQVASDNYLGGYLCAEALRKDFPEGTAIGVLDMPSNGACRDRLDGFMAGLEAAENADAYVIAGQLDGGGMLDSSIQPAEDILIAHPEIQACFTINGLSAQGFITAAASVGREVPKIYTVDASPDDKEFLLDGTIRFEAAQSPFTLAETCFEMADQYLAGKEIEAEVAVPCYEMTLEEAEKTRGSWQ